MSENSNDSESPNLNDVPRLYQESDVIDLLDTLGMGTEGKNYVVDGQFVWGPDHETVIDKLGEATLGILLRAGFNVCGYPRAQATQDPETGDISVEMGEPNGSTSAQVGQVFHRTTLDSPDARTGGKVSKLSA